ncbi:TRAP transporter large permease [Persicirhabdus sediminis]|uniref:TRAP transporter large permease n=1 Tax=Persicirhabdus sediminis TaxID=454144 RepID=A0A8J7MDG4_9BACT|nr:TRAP transporter large permease [Persicirhabdus sediminis]MBK1789934.1 TRAP transporter large permease [Persicirhabdus sediminis]
MNDVIIILLVSFAALLISNTSIAVAIALSTWLCLIASDLEATYVVANRMASGIDSFALLAIPFFILSGILMGKGGMARRLIDFAGACVGRFPGGLGYVNTLTCMLFGSISGSAAAAVSSVGGFMIPEMKRKGYPNEFNVAVTTTAATTGMMIPPSNIMIVYAVASGASIGAMFLAGILPGILTGLAIMVVCFIYTKRKGLAAGERSSFAEIVKTFSRAILSLLLIVIVIGGILGGVFTATEAAAIAVAYSFLLAVVVYREVKLADMPSIFIQTGITTAVVMLLIGASSGMSWLLTIENIPREVSAFMLGISSQPIIILLCINLVLLAVGTFMDMTPAVLIFTPIFLPVAGELGISEIHFGIIMIANLCIGLCTPPVGTCLFIGCGVGKTSIAKVTPAMIPFFIAMVCALLLITFVPFLSEFLPSFLK